MSILFLQYSNNINPIGIKRADQPLLCYPKTLGPKRHPIYIKSHAQSGYKPFPWYNSP